MRLMHPPNFGLIGPLQVLKQTDCFFFGCHETPYWRIFLTKSRSRSGPACPGFPWILQPDLQPQILLSSLLPSLLFSIEVLLQVKTFFGDNNFDKTFQIVFSSALFEVFQQSPRQHGGRGSAGSGRGERVWQTPPPPQAAWPPAAGTLGLGR